MIAMQQFQTITKKDDDITWIHTHCWKELYCKGLKSPQKSPQSLIAIWVAIFAAFVQQPLWPYTYSCSAVIHVGLARHTRYAECAYHEYRWARASYIQTVVEPIRTNRRHYYEDWLGRLDDVSTRHNAEPGLMGSCATCYSINGKCSGYGISYESSTVRFCDE